MLRCFVNVFAKDCAAAAAKDVSAALVVFVIASLPIASAVSAVGEGSAASTGGGSGSEGGDSVMGVAASTSDGTGLVIPLPRFLQHAGTRYALLGTLTCLYESAYVLYWALHAVK